MRKPLLIVITIVSFLNISCKEENNKFPLDKRYWTTEDYEKVILELQYGYKDDEKLPTFDDPETKQIVLKLTDHKNYEVILDDPELGLKYKNNAASRFFDLWRDMIKIYPKRDLKDNYIYEEEMIRVFQFGLGLQIKYFKLGNDEIIASSDSSETARDSFSFRSNSNTIVNNFNLYLDLINEESSFSEEKKQLFAQGIDDYFTLLVNTFPDADYSGMTKKVKLLNKKTQSKKIQSSLESLLALIESKKEELDGNE